MKHHLIGKLIQIVYMKDEPHYTGRTGVVTSVDDAGQLHGTWGGLAILPQVDRFILINEHGPKVD